MVYRYFGDKRRFYRHKPASKSLNIFREIFPYPVEKNLVHWLRNWTAKSCGRFHFAWHSRKYFLSLLLSTSITEVQSTRISCKTPQVLYIPCQTRVCSTAFSLFSSPSLFVRHRRSISNEFFPYTCCWNSVCASSKWCVQLASKLSPDRCCFPST